MRPSFTPTQNSRVRLQFSKFEFLRFYTGDIN